MKEAEECAREIESFIIGDDGAFCSIGPIIEKHMARREARLVKMVEAFLRAKVGDGVHVPRFLSAAQTATKALTAHKGASK